MPKANAEHYIRENERIDHAKNRVIVIYMFKFGWQHFGNKKLDSQ